MGNPITDLRDHGGVLAGRRPGFFEQTPFRQYAYSLPVPQMTHFSVYHGTSTDSGYSTLDNSGYVVVDNGIYQGNTLSIWPKSEFLFYKNTPGLRNVMAPNGYTYFPNGKDYYYSVYENGVTVTAKRLDGGADGATVTGISVYKPLLNGYVMIDDNAGNWKCYTEDLQTLKWTKAKTSFPSSYTYVDNLNNKLVWYTSTGKTEADLLTGVITSTNFYGNATLPYTNIYTVSINKRYAFVQENLLQSGGRVSIVELATNKIIGTTTAIVPDPYNILAGANSSYVVVTGRHTSTSNRMNVTHYLLNLQTLSVDYKNLASYFPPVVSEDYVNILDFPYTAYPHFIIYNGNMKLIGNK